MIKHNNDDIIIRVRDLSWYRHVFGESGGLDPPILGIRMGMLESHQLMNYYDIYIYIYVYFIHVIIVTCYVLFLLLLLGVVIIIIIILHMYKGKRHHIQTWHCWSAPSKSRRFICGLGASKRIHSSDGGLPTISPTIISNEHNNDYLLNNTLPEEWAWSFLLKFNNYFWNYSWWNYSQIPI